MRFASWMRRALAWPLTLACLAGSAWAAAATSIVYQASDLADTVAGQDRWQYTYHVSGTFNPFDSIWLLFDSSRAASLRPLSQPDASWLVGAVDPIASIPADGIFTAQPMTGGAVASAPFVVEFVRLGGEVPGAQAFEIYDGTFALLGEGLTSPIPEPQRALLFMAGLVVLVACRLALRRHLRALT